MNSLILITAPQFYDIDSGITSVLQLRKVSNREVKSFAQNHTTGWRGNKTLIPGSLVPSFKCYEGRSLLKGDVINESYQVNK